MEFIDMWHSYPEPYDDKLDAWLHSEYSKIKKKFIRFDFKSQPYFSPSAVDSCPRELYLKIKGNKRDGSELKPWQRRWMSQGTIFGDWLQRDILLAERNYEKITGEKPPFIMKRNKDGLPYFEDFVKKMKVVNYAEQTFAIFGKPDGILIHQESGTNVGLEIKTKQTTCAKTSLYSLRTALPSHVKQAVCYSIMYGVNKYFIVYVNSSKKGWNITSEEYFKTPDIRVFGVEITKDMKREVLQKFADVVKAVKNNNPPKLDLSRWAFNNYKTTCALDLSEEECRELEDKVKVILESNCPEWKKNDYKNALEFIKEVRGEEGCIGI